MLMFKNLHKTHCHICGRKTRNDKKHKEYTVKISHIVYIFNKCSRCSHLKKTWKVYNGKLT